MNPATLSERGVQWLRRRVEIGPLIEVADKKTVPIHRHSWIYVLGGAALFLFFLQVASGALLMLYYQPTEATANESVRRIMTEVPYGWLIRSIHAWGAHLFITVVVLHFLTTLFSRAYRKPREMTWILGVFLLFISLGFGFSGYLLPWNELSYYATLVGTQIPGTIPVVGDFVVHFLRGGEQVTGMTISRFFAAHVMILPLVLGGLLGLHVGLIQLQGMSLSVGMCRDEVRDRRPFFSEFAMIDACVWLVLFGVIVTLAVFLPAEIGTKADPLQPPPKAIKPEWYFLFMFQTLKYLPKMLGVLLFSLGAIFLVLLPFLDRPSFHEKKSRAWTTLFCMLVGYAALFETIALFAPGAKHHNEPSMDETYHLSSNLIGLVLMWSTILFLLYYLRQFLFANRQLRTMRQRDREGHGDRLAG